MIICDMHTHSSISFDGKDAPEAMCERAIELGLKAYALTDHVECNFWLPRSEYENTNDYDDYDYRSRFEMSLETVPKLKERCKGKLKLLFGCELGQATQAREAAEQVWAARGLDFIIGSLHQVRKHDDFYFINLVNMPQEQLDKLLISYYEELYELACRADFDVLGHITYPLRYIVGEAGRSVDISSCDEIIAEIFKKLITRGKGIEINTSGLRQKYGRTMPELKYVKMFRQSGGEVLTLGSDSHCVKDLGSGIEIGAQIAMEAGFEYISYFEERKPQFIKLY